MYAFEPEYFTDSVEHFQMDGLPAKQRVTGAISAKVGHPTAPRALLDPLV
jgi:hypothetical protein